MITLDTSAVFAHLYSKDQHHTAVVALLQSEQPRFIPVAVMAEIAYLVENKIGIHAMDAFLQDIENGYFSLEWQPGDLPRIRQLALQYSNLPLGFSDASVIAMAERKNGRIATTDRRHFSIVQARRPLQLLP